MNSLLSNSIKGWVPKRWGGLKDDIKKLLKVCLVKNMNNKYPLILALMVSLFSFSQTEKDNYKEVALRFKSLYNSGEYESIYNMFDSNMKKALPLDRTKDFFSQKVKIPYGNLEQMEFYKLKQKARVYKSKFERVTLEILIS